MGRSLTRSARLALSLLAALACARPAPTPALPGWHQSGGAPLRVEEDERALWQEAQREYEKLEEGEELLEDDMLAHYLEQIVAELLPAGLPAEMPAPRPLVIRSADRSAGASADGTLLISTSLLAAIADEAQLAAVLGHELAHLLARHSLIAARYEKTSFSTTARMKLSRRQEVEADQLGLELMQKAGYDPQAAIEMLALLEADGSELRGKPRFQSHPFLADRIHALRFQGFAAAGAGGRREATRYEEAIAEPLLLVAAEIELAAGQIERANAAITRHLRLRPESGRGYYFKGEYARRVAKQGRHSPRARRAYERAVELAPDDPDALRALGFLCRESGEPERARALFGHYLRVAPDAADRKLIERYLRVDEP
jgi:predicted Zn-dependent protease